MSEEPFDDLELGATLRGFASGQVLFGRFRLLRTIGRGGMGVVWLAQDEQLDREVALKFLPEMLVSDRTALEDLKRETRRSLSLTHHHIVRIFDFHQQGNVAGISMEYVDGDTLSNVRVEHGVRSFNPGQLGATVKQLCEALDYAHGRAKIVHRDLKPANLMVNRAGDLKVTDFGISASITESASRVSMRPTGGTLVYMSPQQLMGEEPCVADDIYSLGATLYDLITGKPPFYQGNIDLQVREKVPPPMARRREALGNSGEPIPQVWEETIAACLAKDSAQRPQNAGEVWERLSGTRQVEAAQVTPVSAPEAAKPEVPRVVHASEPAQKLRNKGMLIAALAVLLLAGGAAAFWFGIEQPKRAKAARIAKAQTDAEQRQREGAEAAEEERARLSKLKAEAEKRQHDAAEAARIADEARKKKETDDAAEKERVRLANEKSEAEEKQKQMATQAEAEGQQRQTASKALVLASKEAPYVNSLGMRFVPVPITGGPTNGKRVLFSVWDTRVKDFDAFASATNLGRVKPNFPQTENHPAVMVTWDDAKVFCDWLTEKERKAGRIGPGDSYRLPSDHEWSCAVGIGDRENANTLPKDKDMKIEGEYPWGTQWPPPKSVGNYELDGRVVKYSFTSPSTLPVGSFDGNRYGVHDMGGNVVQWCEDWIDGSKNRRVVRGSDYSDSRYYLLSSCRRSNSPGFRSGSRGFRCVLVVASSSFAPAVNPALKPTATPATVTKDAPFINSLGMKFVPVPVTGGPTGGKRVLFGMWDVRVRDYREFAEETKRAWPKPNFEQTDVHPAVNVSWLDAKAFCEWLTRKERAAGKLGADEEYRLPSDHEWSCAVGIGDREDAKASPADKNTEIADVFPWGKRWPPPNAVGNYDSKLKMDDYEFTSPVGSFAANKYGLYDMGGNVWQWCGDLKNSSDTWLRVRRGGGWANNREAGLLSSCRGDGRPPDRYDDVGFRCVLVISGG